MDLARVMYRETKAMPRDEIYALTSQMRRAATSVPLNIAEGFGRYSRPDFIRSLRIAVGSLMELMTAYELATSMEMIPPKAETVELLQEEARLLHSLIKKLEAKPPQQKKTPRG